MSSPSALIFGAVFLLVLLLVGWLKYGERVELDRHDDSAESDRTDLPSKLTRLKPLLTRFSTVGRGKTEADARHHEKTPV